MTHDELIEQLEELAPIPHDVIGGQDCILAASKALKSLSEERDALREAFNVIDENFKRAVKFHHDDHVPENAVKLHKLLMCLAGKNHGYIHEVDQARKTIGADDA
ncbi:MAG: hypothetical protein COB36_11715 [Alphaproteobacteria bacterium]|nr:MAG: hypothetical protein COB36_11715 [Alphaproteobacteria bacterium]